MSGIGLALFVACVAEPDPAQVFARDVVPVLERSCSASTCHGVGPDSSLRQEVLPPDALFYDVDGSRVLDVAQARSAVLRAVNTVEDPAFSTLLRKPVDPAYGGLPHYGGTNFRGPDDPGLRAIAAWIRLETRGGEDPAPLDPLEQYFADEVQPLLLSMTCASGGCHGPHGAIPFRLHPGIDHHVSITETRANHHAARTMIAVDGDPMQSRLLRKALPLARGGIGHRGGNTTFLGGRDDPRVGPILEWIALEREAALEQTAHPTLEGFVFLRGPVAAEPPLRLDPWVPGTDLFVAWAPGGDLRDLSIEALTASLHDDSADVRDPAVDPTGRRVAFVMRTALHTGHDLWVLDLYDGDATRLTDDALPLPNGGMVTYREPTWGPDGTLYVVSTREGLLADDGVTLDTELYELDLSTGDLRRRSFTPQIEREPIFLVHGEEAGGELAFLTRRDTIGSQRRAHPFRFPPGLETEYHQHFGVTPPENLHHDMRELPDGRYVIVVGDLDNAVEGGRLAILDRNMGPELAHPDDPPSVPFYLPPLVRLDVDARASGVTARLYRDPSPLPDGRLLIATAPGPVDLTAPDAAPALGIALLSLAEAPDGSGPRIAAFESILEVSGESVFDPEPIVRRHLPSLIAPWSWEETAETGTLVHQGAPTIDALLANLPPSGARPLRRFTSARLVESMRVTPDQRLPVPAEETRHGIVGATRTSLGPLGPERVLGVVALEEDQTFQVEMPARIAFRIQFLDEHDLAAGHPHNRWFDVHPGQTIPQGVQPQHYPTLCGMCHGGLDGQSAHVAPEPDLLTTASLSLARYVDRDPRQPRDPVPLGEETRREVDFRRDVQPILTARCAGCHAGDAPPAGLSLTDTPTLHYTDAYESLLAPGVGSRNGMAWVDAPDRRAAGSALAEILLGRELDAPHLVDPPGIAHPSGLSAHERDTLLLWMDLGASFIGTLEAR